MFAMCSATDSFDIALAADGIDICEPMFDGDQVPIISLRWITVILCFQRFYFRA
jgi:hypothetical protein